MEEPFPKKTIMNLIAIFTYDVKIAFAIKKEVIIIIMNI